MLFRSFVVDLRPETYGITYQFVLEPGQSVFVPNYFAHGFLTLKSGTIVNYLVDKDYNKESEVSIKWDSVPDIKETITKYMSGWDLKMIINGKDEDAITIEETTKRKINGKRELKTEAISIPMEEIKETTLLWDIKV